MSIRKPASGGLKPVNSFQQNVRPHNITASRESQGSGQPQVTSTRVLQTDRGLRHENNHVAPNKRPRIDNDQSSSLRAHSTISIDSAEDDDPDQRQQNFNIRSTRSSMMRPDDLEMRDGPGSQDDSPKRRKSLPLQELEADEVLQRDENSLRHMPGIQNSLMSRLQQGSDNDPFRKKVRMDALLRSSPTAAAIHQLRETKTKQTPFQLPMAHSRRSAQAQVLIDDTPDELESTITTIRPAATRFRRASTTQRRGRLKVGDRLTLEEGRLIQKHDLSHLKSYTYPLNSVPGYDGLAVSESELVLSPDLQHFWIFLRHSVLDGGSLINLPLSKISKIDNAPDGTKIILILSSNVINHDKLYLDFQSPKDLADFSLKIQGRSNFRFVERTPEHLDRAFKKFSEDIRTSGMLKNAVSDDIAQPIETAVMHKTDHRGPRDTDRRPRLVDRLDSPDPVIAVTPTAASQRAARFVRSLATETKAARQNQRSPTTTSIRSPYFGEEQFTRATRSNGKRQAQTNSPQQKADMPSFRVSSLIKVKTDKPLVLHGPLKKSESLSHDDFERLDDEEFLNDNLISFFLLYLQTRGDPECLKRMHFFNTFFYSTLTKDAKGKTSINYDAVARWTKNVNLFSRDFVIVPVNENYHWFVMIICNLPALRYGDADTVLQNDHIDEDPGYESDHENNSPGQTASATHEATTESFQDLSLEDEVRTTPRSKRLNGNRKMRKNIVRAKRRYDVRKPVIITLDSLDNNRSATATQLKKYIAALAADTNQNHESFKVDFSTIPGMTAKEIPHQKNWSDCGLYLCMYMEQFIRNPDTFIRKVLQRENNGPMWPRNITSRRLRERLAIWINSLYEQQVDPSAKIALPQLGSILIDMLPPEDEIAEITPSAKSNNRRHEEIVQKWNDWEDRQSAKERPASDDLRLDGEIEKAQDEAVMTSLDAHANPVLPIEAGRQNQFAVCEEPQTPNSYIAESVIIPDGDDAVAGDQHAAAQDSVPDYNDNPRALATRLAEQRSPQMRQTSLATERNEQAPRQRSFDSVSTDFLTGTKSYMTSTGNAKRSRSRSLSVPRSSRVRLSVAHSTDLELENEIEVSEPMVQTERGTVELAEIKPRPKRTLLSGFVDARSIAPAGNHEDDNAEEMLI